MLSKESRLKLVEIACKMRLKRKVTLLERIWAYKIVREYDDAASIMKRFTC